MSLPVQEANAVKELYNIAIALMHGDAWPWAPMTCRHCLGSGSNSLGYDCGKCGGAGELYDMAALRLRLRDATKHYPYPVTIDEKFDSAKAVSHDE